MSFDSIGLIKSLIRDVADFPKAGILFKDITPVLSDRAAFKALIEEMAPSVPAGMTKIVAIESRGFILGSALALELGLGLVLIRKPGKLPYATLSHSYDLEYGKDALQIHVDALDCNDRVCIVDDVLATGGTAGAAEVLCRETGAAVCGFSFLMELQALNGRAKLTSPARALIRL